MDIAIHAQLISRYCDPSFAALIMQVPARYGKDWEYAVQLICTLSHANSMARLGSQGAWRIIFNLAESHVKPASRRSFAVQDAMVIQLIGFVSDADLMARVTPEAKSEIFSLMQPVIDTALNDQVQIELVNQQRVSAWAEIVRASHRSQMKCQANELGGFSRRFEFSRLRPVSSGQRS